MQWTAEQLAKGKKIIQQQLEMEGLDQYAFLKPEQEELSEEIQSIVVVLFPYYTGAKEGNLSMYCRGIDYHTVVPKYLNPVGEQLRRELGDTVHCGVYADTGPLRDRYLALRAGLGFIGRNQMMINPKYGSYCFIAYITVNTIPVTELLTNASNSITITAVVQQVRVFTRRPNASYITPVRNLNTAREIEPNPRTTVINSGLIPTDAICALSIPVNP
jgi:hypothetical protein